MQIEMFDVCLVNGSMLRAIQSVDRKNDLELLMQHGYSNNICTSYLGHKSLVTWRTGCSRAHKHKYCSHCILHWHLYIGHH